MFCIICTCDFLNFFFSSLSWHFRWFERTGHMSHWSTPKSWLSLESHARQFAPGGEIDLHRERKKRASHSHCSQAGFPTAGHWAELTGHTGIPLFWGDLPQGSEAWGHRSLSHRGWAAPAVLSPSPSHFHTTFVGAEDNTQGQKQYFTAFPPLKPSCF